MTVCISGICNDGNSVVAISDKMITAHSPYVEFEPDIVKSEYLSSRCIVLSAGSALRQIELCRAAKRKILEGENPSISSIVDIVKNNYGKLRRKKIEELYLIPRGLNLNAFYENMNVYPREFSLGMDNDILKFNYGLLLLISGVDETGGHIYRIDNPGFSECFDSIGFNAIGGGQDHAVLSLIGNKYSIKVDLKEAIYLIYEAKRKSEIAPGVGVETDVYIIKDEKIMQLSIDTIKELEEIYNKRMKPRTKDTLDMIEKLNIIEM